MERVNGIVRLRGVSTTTVLPFPFPGNHGDPASPRRIRSTNVFS